MTHMGGSDRLAQVQAVLTALFEWPVAVGVTDPRATQPALMAGEGAHVARAIPSRQREFAAGRAAARAAMAQLGHAAAPILAHTDRAPIWPPGLTGSISHSATLCAAAVTQAGPSVGLDLEASDDLAPDLLHSVCSEDELARIAGPDQRRLAKLIFCAKEAAYKAQYPLTGALFGFDHIDITLDLAERRFTATFVKPVGQFAAGAQLPGRFDQIADHFVAAVWVGQKTQKGA